MINSQSIQVVATILLATAILMSVAIWNGYPLVYPDTSEYISGFKSTMRTPYYGFLVSITSVTGTLWTVIIIQSLIMTVLLYRFTAILWKGFYYIRFLFVVLLLVILSPLSWYCGFVMADIFTASMILGVILMTFYRKLIYSTGFWIIFSLVVFSGVTHLATFLVLGLLALFLLATRVPWAQCKFALLAFLMCAFCLGLTNWLHHKAPRITVSGDAFLLANFAEDGTLKAYLDSACTHRQYQMCKHRDMLPMSGQVFLWSDDSPFSRVGGWSNTTSEYRNLTIAVLLDYPGQFLKGSVRRTLAQLLTYRHGPFIPFSSDTYPTAGIKEYYPGDYEAYLGSRQNMRTVGQEKFYRLHQIVFFASLAVSLLLAWYFRRPEDRPMLWTILTTWIAILLSAFVTGTFSDVNLRYFAKISWLIPFIAFSASLHIFGQRQSARHKPGGR